MKLGEIYSLVTGSKFGRPYLNEKVFPLPFDRYVTFSPYSKASKSYDLWDEVMQLILPIFKENNIQIVQLGAKDERPVVGCHNLAGQTSIAQCNFLIRNALLHFGVDTFTNHVASGYDKKLVCLYSNNYASVVGPNWGSPENQILLEPPKIANKELKPSFSYDENPKTINTISPIDIAKSICKLLNLNLDYPYTQLFLGSHHINHIWEAVPNNLVNLQSLNLSNIVVRMDFFHNEEVLEKQLQIGNVAIVCSQPIDIELLRKYKSRITELVYEIDENHVPNFVEEAQKVGLNKLVLISKLSEEQLNPVKLYYIDIAPILPVPTFKKESIQEIKGENDLYYRSRKFTISNNKVYPSKAAWLEDKPMNLAERNLFPVIDNDTFFEESQHFAILKKTS